MILRRNCTRKFYQSQHSHDLRCKFSHQQDREKSSVTVGDTITYTYNVTNEGNVNLCNIDIQGPGSDSDLCSGDTSGEDCLNLTETWKFTGSYLVTQSDICDDISNTATVTADDPCGGTALENSTSLSILGPTMQI